MAALLSHAEAEVGGDDITPQEIRVGGGTMVQSQVRRSLLDAGCCIVTVARKRYPRSSRGRRPPLSRFTDRHFAGFPRVRALSIRTSATCADG